MITADLVEKADPFNVHPVLEDTRALARAMAEGRTHPRCHTAAPHSMQHITRDFALATTVEEVARLGVMLIIVWIRRQSGRGNEGWSLMLQAWLDDGQNDVGNDKRAGFWQLEFVLEKIDRSFRGASAAV